MDFKMTKDEAMKLALEALEYYEVAGLATTKVVKSITALREALAQERSSDEQPAQQEPVDSTQISKVWWDGEKLMAKPIPFVEFYKPAQRTWVGLTDDEISILSASLGFDQFVKKVVRCAEAKLKEKNCG